MNVVNKPRKLYGMAAKFAPWGITTYSYLIASDFASSDKKVHPDSKKGENQHKGFLSLAAGKKLRETVNMFTYLLKWKKITGEDYIKDEKFEVVLITLTLPSIQQHSDLFLKKECLGTFLELIRYHHGITLYIWKAEVQNNGNIHFHITGNKRIPHHLIQLYWNRILEPFGYIDEYQKAAKTRYPDGYKYDPTLREYRKKEKRMIHVPEWEQKKRYITGSKSDWRNPHSTEIASVKNIKDLPSYLAGELAKKDVLKSNAPDCIQEMYCDFSGNDDKLLSLKEKFPEYFKRTIKGNLWGCSQALTKPSLTLFETEDDLSDWHIFLNDETVCVKSEAYYQVYRFKDKFMLHGTPYIINAWNAHCIRMLSPPILKLAG